MPLRGGNLFDALLAVEEPGDGDEQPSGTNELY